VVTRVKRLMILLLMIGMENLCEVGLKLRMLLNEMRESWTEAIVVKLVRRVNSFHPSSSSGKFPAWEKMVGFRSPVTEDSKHLNNALAFWIARSSIRAMEALVISVSATEW